jgi:hypothetical protein
MKYAKMRPLTARLQALGNRNFFVGLGALLLCGCLEPDVQAPDLMLTQDLQVPADLAMLPPDLTPALCELPYDQRAINSVSTGKVTVGALPADPSVFAGQIDATAGGSMMYDKNPFVYLNLLTQQRVDITDVQARTSKDWDIAFKRWQIKLNSGDSGPGGVTVATVANQELAQVTMVPVGPYVADSYFNAKCELKTDPIGGLGTALSDWYEYDQNNKLTPLKQVFVLPRRDGKGHIKLQILGYYSGMFGGIYSLQWSFLP